MKTDFKKSLDCYRPGKPGAFRVLEVPELTYLAIDGYGDPNCAPEYASALEALYPLAYKLKFMSRAQLDRDYVVMPLEGLWTADDMTTFTTARDKSAWAWTLLMMVPDWITQSMLDEARDVIMSTASSAAVGRAAELLRLQTLQEQTCVQTLHVGSYDDEAAILQQLHDEVIPGLGYRMRGLHHEIYLSDARRVEPARLRTLLRQPVTR
ncbi:GyrI-like domain-containing protein [Herbiconiux sp. CPCC 203407]|uniref:GyrI-like domain-containing protein n=1 Tax=Herbiconiux oxytropis TaxID=2970915 RepID=A0AA41XKF4_9MICO|nr:GyrI-like domain-containing protein [Herbiconiux oxytropis]MCS5721850.1 GyrI-like domain-containing protein [Herbiconiux oxytropis]MCS5727376.1 GyrI-like domain-containing protein [Herbiconiux oxytropis]